MNVNSFPPKDQEDVPALTRAVEQFGLRSQYTVPEILATPQFNCTPMAEDEILEVSYLGGCSTHHYVYPVTWETQRCTFLVQLNVALTFMERYWNEWSDSRISVNPLYKSVFAALHDNEWFRVQVMGVHLGPKGYVMVSSLDYGWTKNVRVSDLRPLPLEFMALKRSCVQIVFSKLPKRDPGLGGRVLIKMLEQDQTWCWRVSVMSEGEPYTFTRSDEDREKSSSEKRCSREEKGGQDNKGMTNRTATRLSGPRGWNDNKQDGSSHREPRAKSQVRCPVDSLPSMTTRGDGSCHQETMDTKDSSIPRPSKSTQRRGKRGKRRGIRSRPVGTAEKLAKSQARIENSIDSQPTESGPGRGGRDRLLPQETKDLNSVSNRPSEPMQRQEKSQVRFVDSSNSQPAKSEHERGRRDESCHWETKDLEDSISYLPSEPKQQPAKSQGRIENPIDSRPTESVPGRRGRGGQLHQETKELVNSVSTRPSNPVQGRAKSQRYLNSRLPPSEVLDVAVVHSGKEGTFVIALHDIEKFQLIEEALNKLSKSDLDNAVPTVNKLCLAPFRGSLYRARVIQSCCKTFMCRVSFVDYGNEEDVSMKHVRVLPENISHEIYLFRVDFTGGAPKNLEPGTQLKVFPCATKSDGTIVVQVQDT